MTHGPSNPTAPRAGDARFGALSAILAAALLTGCGERIDTEYGRRFGPGATASVNGTAVLADLFEQQGHRVTTTSWLTPRLSERADVIVWFPDRFHPPGDETIDWMESWLWSKGGRTLIYVGRDYDAAADYWRTVQATAPANQVKELKRREGVAKSDFNARRAAQLATPAPPGGTTSPDLECDWFTFRTGSSPRSVRTLDGDAQWLEGVDPAQLEIELRGRFLPPEGTDVLLESNGDALVTSRNFSSSRLIVVTNGSFLLNLPLVNHEHRKLAGALVAEVRSDRDVVFVESGSWGDPPIRDEDVNERATTGLEILAVAPFDSIFLHLAIVGIIFCFARLPIFGLPRALAETAPSDFGQHVEAMGELLERTGDYPFASSTWERYQQSVRSEQGRSKPSHE